MTDINKKLKEMQYKSLIELYEKIKQVAYERPLDSEDDDEEEIWDLIDDLEAQMDDFFKDKKTVKGKIVKNVIRGHLVHDEIERICIIDVNNMEVIFNGELSKYMDPPEIMRDEKDKYDKMIVRKSNVDGTRLDIFI